MKLPKNTFATADGKVNLLIVLAATLVLGLVLVIVVSSWLDQQIEETPLNEQATVVFTNPDNKQTISVVFNNENNTAVLSGAGYDDVVFTSAIAASGARYVNEEQGLELWNRGNNITLSRGDDTLFVGNVGGLSEVDKLISGTWVWQATTVGEVVTEPRRTDAFTVTFNADGQISGTTDCNGFFASYEVKADGSLNISPLGMTKMYCEGSQEMEFVTPLEDVASFSFAGSGALVLELKEGKGTMLFGKQ